MYKIKYVFYSLSDPVTKEVRYIGVTTSKLNVRYAQHKYNATNISRRTTPIAKWFYSLLNKGIAPTINIVSIFKDYKNSNLWELIEQCLIKQHTNLLNLHEGGKGVVKGERKLTSIHNMKPTVQIHPWKDIILREFPSCSDAEVYISGKTKLKNSKNKRISQVISQTCNGKHAHSFGYRWAYKNHPFPPKLPHLFIYNNSNLIAVLRKSTDLRLRYTKLLSQYSEITISKNFPTFSPKDNQSYEYSLPG